MVDGAPSTSSTHGARAAPAPSDPDPGFWYLRLLFRPGAFLRESLRGAHPFAIGAAAAVVGMAAAIGRLEKTIAKHTLAGRSLGFLGDIVDNWGGYWLWVLFLGGFGAGCSYYYFGGWWFRKRLLWAGAVDPDVTLTRRAYVMCGLVDSIPLLVGMAWRTLVFPEPITAQSDSALLWNVVLLFPFWAAVVSYRAAVSVFGAGGWRAKMLFWLLPWTLYGLALAALVGAVFALVMARGA